MRDLTYAELFAGAGGLSMGLDMAGWTPVAHAEIEPHARAVLRKHWPSVRLDGDVSQLNGADYHGITLLSGGSPCQDLSIAGKRGGMTEGSGTRSALYFEQVRIWQESQAPYFLWENVLGALSSNAGRDFAAVLSALVGAAVPVPDDGWGGAGVASGPTGVAAWRVLDAQYFGVPQRRRRVFVLGARAGGVDPAEVLSLGESVSRDSAPRREAREGTAEDSRDGAEGALNGWDGQRNRIHGADGIAPTLQAPNGRGGQQPAVLPTGFSTTASVGYVHDVMPSLPHLTGLNCPGAQMLGVIQAAFPLELSNQGGGGNLGFGQDGDPARTKGTSGPPGVVTYEWHGQDSRVKEVGVASSLNNNAEGREGHLVLPISPGVPRRLTPVECERLMGWPDNHTAHGIDEKGRDYALADTARYKLCGNGVATPVAAWIGFRLRELLTAS